MEGTRTPIETKIRGSRTPLLEDQTDLTTSKVITSPAVYFKRKVVFTLVEIDVPSSNIETFMVAFLLPRLSTLFAEVAAVGPSTRAVPKEVEFEDTFVNIALG
jgi:hypothetical protein